MEITIDIIFSILNMVLSVTAIWIAIKSSRDTSKDATKQIESIKGLAKIQIETSIKQMEVEIKRNILLAQQAKEELNKMQEINNSPLAYQTDWKNEMLRRNKEEKPKSDLQFYNSYINSLNNIYEGLNKIKESLNK